MSGLFSISLVRSRLLTEPLLYKLIRRLSRNGVPAWNVRPSETVQRVSG